MHEAPGTAAARLYKPWFIPNDCLSRWPVALDRTHGFGESLAPNGPLPSFLIFLGQPATPPDAVPVNRRQGQSAIRRRDACPEPTGSSVLRIQGKPRVRHGRGGTCVTGQDHLPWSLREAATSWTSCRATMANLANCDPDKARMLTGGVNPA
jgi:uncharacterized Zn-binding protein involved in type VI secretion